MSSKKMWVEGLRLRKMSWKLFWVQTFIICYGIMFLSTAAEARRSLRLDPGGKGRQEAERTRRFRKPQPWGTPEEMFLWDEAEKAFMLGQYQQALKFYKKLLKNYPRSNYYPQALYREGLCCLKTDLFAEARACFNQLLKMGKKTKGVSLDQVQLSLADSYFLEEDIDRAFGEYRRLLVNYPDSEYLARVYFQLGECSRKQGRWSQAKYYFQKVSQDYPLSFEAKQLSQLWLNEVLFFEIQVGSFEKKDNAQKLCEQLLSKGYQAYVSRVTSIGKTFYRVRVGKFDSRAEAEFCEKKLRKEGLPTKIYP